MQTISTPYTYEGIQAIIARGALNDAIASLKEYREHLTTEDKLALLTILQMQDLV